MTRSKAALAVVPDLALYEVRVQTELVMRLRAEDEEDAKRKSLGLRLWLTETAESRKWLECVAWGPERLDVGEVI